MIYKLKSGTHTRWENGNLVTYKSGDTLSLTDAQAESMGDRVERTIAEVGDEGDKDKLPADDDTKWDYLAGLPWSTAAKALRDLEDINELSEAIEAERKGKNRTAVIEAGEARAAELTGT